MANYSFVASEWLMERANQNGVSPQEYLDTVAKTLNTYNDRRQKDRYGMWLTDLKVTRTDGSSFIIHEDENQDVEGFQKVTVISKQRNDTPAIKFSCYSDGIDFEKIQTDNRYLDALADMFLAHDRLERYQRSSRYNFAYLGELHQERNGEYRKVLSTPTGYLQQDVDVAKSMIENRIAMLRDEPER